MMKNGASTINNGILIVEDERIVALDMAQSLKQLGYSVVGIASTGEAAIKIAVDQNPGLIIMDVRLKGVLDGIDTAKKINSAADIPFIYITAFTDDETLERAKATEPFGYLLKPYDKRSLYITIEMALYKHHMEKRIRDSEKRFAKAFHASPNTALISRMSDGQIIEVNNRWENLFEYSPEEINNNGLNVFNFFFRKDVEQKIYLQLKEKGTVRDLETEIKRKSGEVRQINLSIEKIELNGEPHLLTILNDITDRKKAEKDREVLFKKVSATQKRLKALSGRLIEVQETERRNLARELHDELGQLLTAIKINMQTAHDFIGSQEMEPHINEAIELTEEAIKQVRSLSLDLRPSMLDDLGLVPALRSYVDRQTLRTGIAARLIAEPFEKRLSPNLEITCYRITQEAFTNIIRHAGKEATVKIELWKENNELNLKISDTGKGFDVYAALQRSLSGESMGILGMQERVELVGGRLKINSKADKGTDIHAIFTIDK